MAIDAVCGSRPGKALKRERDSFKRNGGKGRMNYARVASLKLPISSSAIESAIRWVVNLRLKGPSIYWHKTSAEAILLLLSYKFIISFSIFKLICFTTCHIWCD